MESLRYGIITIAILLLVVALTFFSVVLNESRNRTPAAELINQLYFPEADSIDAVSYNPSTRQLYAADKQNGVIYVADLKGRIWGKLKHRRYGEKGFLSIYDIAFYENGLLVSDPLERQIFYCRLKRTPAEFIESTLPVNFRPGLIHSPDSQSVYATGIQLPLIYRFDEFGKIADVIQFSGLKGSLQATGIYSSVKNIKVSDSNLSSILNISRSRSERIKLSGRTGSYSPFGLTEYNGFLVTADPFFGEVIFFESSGREVFSFGKSRNPEKSLNLPVDVCCYKNLIFVAEKGGRRVSVWRIRY
jgi:hypothetical protein